MFEEAEPCQWQQALCFGSINQSKKTSWRMGPVGGEDIRTPAHSACLLRAGSHTTAKQPRKCQISVRSVFSDLL